MDFQSRFTAAQLFGSYASSISLQTTFLQWTIQLWGVVPVPVLLCRLSARTAKGSPYT